MVKTEKKCKICNVFKCTDEFYTFKRSTKNGLSTYMKPYCKACESKKTAKWNKDNRAKRMKTVRKSYRRRKLGIKRKPRETYEELRERERKYSRKYERERRRSDPNYRLLKNLRSRVRQALKGKHKSAATKALLGICVDECRKYIEALFTEGMSWDSDIHIDHIVPCASFDLSDPEQQRRCFHYTNLQPLWGPDNLKKSAKITPQAEQREWNGSQWVDKVLE